MLTSIKDIIFGSEGTSQADFERMEEINNEIGLTAMIRSGIATGEPQPEKEAEKVEHAQ